MSASAPRLCIRCEKAPRYKANRYCLPCMTAVWEERDRDPDVQHRRLLTESGRRFDA